MKKIKLTAILLTVLLLTTLICGCSSESITPDMQHRNLQKLCKVWGFAKYTHQVFLLGLSDWDNELLELIPMVISVGEDKANDILYEWFIGFGDDGYENLPAETDKKNLRYMADTGWITEEYLGEPLTAVLSQFKELPDIDRANAPVSFDHLNNSDHSNEKFYQSMDYGDNRYRLLGLFRLWNAIKYYFPYMDIIDDDWNGLLLEHIAMMLNGTDMYSYEEALASLVSKLDDAHIFFVRSNGTSFGTNERLTEAWQNNYVPSPAESHALLENNIGLINPSKLSSGEIHDIMKKFADTNGLIIDLRQYPSDNLIYSLAEYIVDRKQPFAVASVPFISIPGVFADGEPQYSGHGWFIDEIEELRQTYLDYSESELEKMRTLYIEYGIDIGYSFDAFARVAYGISPTDIEGLYYYDKKVALIMNEQTMSQSEFTIMSLRNSSNVTVIGRNSIGADGNVTTLPLPGGITMQYTGLGIYYPDGGQTQRTGLAPDIYIERDNNISGDQLMEAAMQFIIGE